MPHPSTLCVAFSIAAAIALPASGVIGSLGDRGTIPAGLAHDLANILFGFVVLWWIVFFGVLLAIVIWPRVRRWIFDF